MLRTGRKRRTLEDTAVASHLLRAGSPNWNDLRRDQDYYFEGALLWMEADAIIRQQTKGARSLDDFCRKFLGQSCSEADTVPYDCGEIVALLKETADFHWEHFLNERTGRPLDVLPLDLVGRLGYRLEYARKPPEHSIDRARGGISAQHSLGLTFSSDGQITNIVPGMAGDKARLVPGTRVIGINGRLFSPRQLQDALAGSVALRKIELLVLEGDRFKTIILDYADGPKFPVLVRDESKPDLLAAILKPIAGQPQDSAEQKPRPGAGSALPKGYVAYRPAEPITIDGKLDDKAWKAVPWTDAFVDIEGDRKPRPRYQTRAKMLWDDQYLYIGAQLDEPHVWATLIAHDAVIFQDNDFEIFIDPDGDNHEYYEIEINALNTEWDLFLGKPYRDGGPAVNAWEIPGLKTAVHVQGTLNDARDTDRFWSVEFAIPWKALAKYAHRPAPPHDGDQWRIDFSRVEWQHEVREGKDHKVPGTHEDNWVWSPQGVVDMHRPETWGYVQFSTAQPGSVSFQPDRAGPIRNRLIEVYHAQKKYHDKAKRWADKVSELDLPACPTGSPELPITLRSTPEGYEAAITFTPDGGSPQTWTVRQDSRLVRSR